MGGTQQFKLIINLYYTIGNFSKGSRQIFSYTPLVFHWCQLCILSENSYYLRVGDLQALLCDRCNKLFDKNSKKLVELFYLFEDTSINTLAYRQKRKTWLC